MRLVPATCCRDQSQGLVPSCVRTLKSSGVRQGKIYKSGLTGRLVEAREERTSHEVTVPRCRLAFPLLNYRI